MTDKDLVEYTKKCLEEFARLPAKEQTRRMVEAGIINEKGEVLWGPGVIDEGDPPDEVSRNGQPGPA